MALVVVVVVVGASSGTYLASCGVMPSAPSAARHTLAAEDVLRFQCARIMLQRIRHRVNDG